MTYTKKRIMERAHSLRKHATLAGRPKELSMSEALCAAWAEAKADNARTAQMGLSAERVNARIAKALEAAEQELNLAANAA